MSMGFAEVALIVTFTAVSGSTMTYKQPMGGEFTCNVAKETILEEPGKMIIDGVEVAVKTIEASCKVTVENDDADTK